MFLEKVISIEKMEDTSLLPNPIIVSIRSKTAFQFIELKERDALVENLLQRLKAVNSSNPVHCNNLQSKNQVLNFYGFLNYEFIAFIHWSVVLLFSGISFGLVLSDAFGVEVLTSTVVQRVPMVQLWPAPFEGSSEYTEDQHCPSQRPQKSDGMADRDFVKFNKSKSEVWQSSPLQRRGLGWLAREQLGCRSMELVVDTRPSTLVSSALLQ